MKALAKTYFATAILMIVVLVLSMFGGIMDADVDIERSNAHTIKPKVRWRRAVLSPLFCSVFASLGIFGGISTLFVGLVCIAVHSLFISDSAFDIVGTILLIAAIPMILMGSVFLDEMDKGK